MKRKFLLVCLVLGTFSYAQYKENTPWMKELKKSKPLTGKNAETGYSLYDISDAFHKYWEGKDPSIKGSGFKPFMRWENYWSHFVDANGNFPTTKELWDSYISRERGIGTTNATSSWTALGPIRPGVLSGSLPGTGRINTAIVDPNDPTVWYAGAPAGGIWKSTDSGANWTNLFDDFPQIGVSGIAIDPNNSDIIYIATGDDDAGDSFSAGVFKSLNGGQTWNETELNPSNSNFGLLMNEIFINPNNTDIVFVGTTQGLFRTIDGGDNWEEILSGEIDDFRLKPNDPNTIYAVRSSRYFRSTNGGDDFESITDILPTTAGRSVIEVTEANPDVLYIMMAETFTNGGGFLGLFKSTDSGSTFAASPNVVNIFEANQTFFNLALEVSPTDEDLLFTGALNIWRSSNGGDVFSQVNEWFTNNASYTHADIHFLRYFGNTLFAGTDGGLYTSTDNGNTFTDRTENMEVTQFYRIDIGTNEAGRVAGGTQDNSGFVLNDGQWNVYTGGDGMDYEIDPNNSNVIYGFTQFGGFLFITTDAGQTIGVVRAPTVTDNNGTTTRLQGNWITPLAVDSNGEVYSGYDALYRLNGNEWEKISADIGSSPIEDIEIDPNDPENIYLAEGTTLFRSQNAGLTFIPVQSFDTEISSIDINNNDGNIVYVTTSRRVGISQANQPADRGVFRVEINGTVGTATNITFDLPTDQAFFAIEHQGRHTDNPIYVGTNVGIYRLDDTLTGWEEYFTGLPTVAVSDMEISLDEGTLVASTYGRGVWQSPLPVQIPDNEIRLVSITPEADQILCGEIFPQVQVENIGSNPITQIDVEYQINDGAVQNFVWNGTLDPAASLDIDLPALNLSTFGRTDFSVTVNIANDTFDDNNQQSVNFVNNQFGTGDQLFDFESEATGLVTFNSSGEGSVWERGVPEGNQLNQASSGTQVVATNLDGAYPNATKGFVVSGCYELSSILAPVLKFQMAYDLELNFDIVYVEYSIDSGSSWSVLGTVDSEPNWYVSDRTNASSGEDDDCQNCPGAQWTGTNVTMTEYAYDFIANAARGETDLTNESNIIFRIVFESDPAVSGEGVVIDDFLVEGFQDDEDDDNDGILDVDDNCPLVGNFNQLDTDLDGDGDACDLDDDNDGVLDVDDNCPLTPNPDQEDADNDGIGDVCDNDADNDGVPNDLDLCPDTPQGTTVDVDGCPVFSLPSDNFGIRTIGESCISSDNGQIEITANTALNYTAVLSDDAGGQLDTASFTQTTTFTDLTAGNYQLCLTVEGEADFEQCFDISISQPEPLDVAARVSSLADEVTLQLKGAVAYTIELNGEVFRTAESEITLPLNKIENVLTVKTDRECQGIYENVIVLSSNIFIYPNPNTTGELNIYLGSDEFNQVTTSMFNLSGTRVYAKTFAPDNGFVVMNISGLPQGVYLLNIETGKSLLTYKIIRR